MIGLGLMGLALGGGQARSAGAVAALPYNNIFIANIGDSRRVQGGGLSGAYGSGTGLKNAVTSSNGTGIDGYLAQALNNRIRIGQVYPGGIGSTNAQQIFAWPRSVALGTYAGRIDNGTPGNAGNILTITSIASGSDANTIKPELGMAVTAGTGVTGYGRIQPYGTGGTTGTGGLGTYVIDGPAQNVASTGTLQISFLDTNTIAQIASNQAAIVVTMAGTNSSGSSADLAAMDVMIKALTTPGYPYPNYRPNGEATDQPLPLYNGLPKTIWLFNETRRGVGAGGPPAVTGNYASNPTQFHNFAIALKRYDYASGDATYGNQHVVVFDSYDDPRLADLTDTTNFSPLPGFFADELHLSPPAPFVMASIGYDRINPILPATVDYAPLPTTLNASSFITLNGTFSTKNGGTWSIGTNTVTLNGAATTASAAIPSGWSLIVSGSNLTVDITYHDLGGNLGNEMVLTVTGNPTGNSIVRLQSNISSTQWNVVDLSTDTIVFSVRSGLTIRSGSVYGETTQLSLQNGSGANAFTATAGLLGNSLGYGNVAPPANPMLLKNGWVDTNHDYVTTATPYASLVGNGIAAGTHPSLVQALYILSIAAGTVDLTAKISQPGVCKV